MGDLYLGVDVGTTSAKCLAVDERGQAVGFGQQHYALHHPRAGWAEQDPEALWQGLAAAVRACLAQCPERGPVAGLALSTQADTLIPVDAQGRPLRPALSWMDGRAQAEQAALLAETGRSFWYRHTGKALTPLSSACKIRWLREHEPALQPARYCWVPDYLAWRLCGQFATDTPSASWSPFFSPTCRQWVGETLAAVGVEQGQLPEVVASGQPLGELLPGAAAELGLAPGTMLLAGAFDQVAAAHGAGAEPHQVGVLSCGTAWVLYCVVAQPPVDPQEAVPVCCHVDEEQWGLVLPFAGGAALDWFRSAFPAGPEAAGGGPLVFIPHLYGGLAPDWREESRGSLLGLGLAHGWQDVERAVRVGITCEARRNLAAAERLAGRMPLLRMVGGAARDPAWPQLVADLLDRPTSLPEVTEAACYGAARLAAGKAAASWQIREAHQLAPDPARRQELQEDYARYLRCYQALLPVYGQWS